MTETLNLNLLSIRNSRRQVNIFFDNSPLYTEAIAVSAWLSDYAASPIAFLAPFSDAVVADNSASATALIAFARLAPLLGPGALASDTYDSLVHLNLLL
jgi:hypothetical protein